MTITFEGKTLTVAEHNGWEILAKLTDEGWFASGRSVRPAGFWTFPIFSVDRDMAMIGVATSIDIETCYNCHKIDDPEVFDSNNLCPDCSARAEESSSRSLYGSAGLGWEAH